MRLGNDSNNHLSPRRVGEVGRRPGEGGDWKKLRTNYARELRKNQTDTERRLWQLLRSRQLEDYKFRRQRPIGRFIVDFCSFKARLVIELDGGQHIEDQDYDMRRTAELNRRGFKVVRFWDHEVLRDSHSIIDAIRAAM